MQLKELSYYGTGGTCDEMVSPASLGELAEAAARIYREQRPCFLLGAGSNSLIMDEHWPGSVLLFDRLQGLEIDGNRVVVQAGVENTRLAEACLKNALTGAEWMYHLPGQLGATVRMNARCYGGEIGRIVTAVTTITRRGRSRRYSGGQVFKGYKDTIFMCNEEIVAEIEMVLGRGDPEQIGGRMAFCRSDREQKHQFDHPSCGCVFRNDYSIGIPSGLLLDRAGVKDLSSDRVQVGPWHANFLFNRGATARELLETALQMREAVYQRFGVWLAFEMEILGVLPADLKTRVDEVRRPQPAEAELALLRSTFQTGG